MIDNNHMVISLIKIESVTTATRQYYAGRKSIKCVRRLLGITIDNKLVGTHILITSANQFLDESSFCRNEGIPTPGNCSSMPTLSLTLMMRHSCGTDVVMSSKRD